MRAEAPRGDREVLLLSETFLRSSISCYSVPRINENNNNVKEQPFFFKCINIVDPLRPNNNLGRSISRGSYVRIKSAIANGEERIIRLLESAEENVIAEFDSFFKNTWNRSGKGYWIPSFHENNNSSSKHVNEIGTSFDAAPSSWSPKSSTTGSIANSSKSSDTRKDHTNNKNNNAAIVTDQGSHRHHHHHHHSSSMNESGDSASNVIINNELSGVNMPCSNPDALPLYLLEQQINNLKLGNNNNNNNLQAQQEKSDNQGVLAGPMALNMESTLLADVLEGDFASHWKNMQNARLSLDGKLQGPFCCSGSPIIPPLQSQLLLGKCPPLSCASIVPNMMLPSSGDMSQSHPLLPLMQNSGPNCESVPFGFGEHPRHHKLGTGTFIPDPESYKQRVKFHARKRNYDRPREGRFNYEYERTNSGGADYNYRNLVWKPVEIKRYTNIGNHKEASSSSTAGTNSEKDFAHSSSNQPSSPNISG
ncbi:Poly(A) RNA polymerase [Arachis hypogaea]|nr:Poly(A) RNA polymerase [Arachis hypogaea]